MKKFTFFITRRICVAHTMPCQDICLSVRPSVTRQCSVCHRVAPPFYFFHTKRDGNLPTGSPVTARFKCKGGMKNHEFPPISRFISEMMQNRAIVTMEDE